MSDMINFLNTLLDLIYRKKCYFCGKSNDSVKMCQNCYNELEYTNTDVNRIIDGVNIYTCGIYEKNMQKLIRGLKYHKQKELAYYLAKFMYEYFKKLNLEGIFQVVPVPLHKNRVKKRKYNHMELVAEDFCRLSGFPINFELITRIKDTKPQYRLSRKERMKNLENAFEVDKTKDLHLQVLLIDDICTTGSTFEEMITTLKKEGITDIVCLASSNPQ